MRCLTCIGSSEVESEVINVLDFEKGVSPLQSCFDKIDGAFALQVSDRNTQPVVCLDYENIHLIAESCLS